MLVSEQSRIASPPPCWCGQTYQAHEESATRAEPARDDTRDHPYVPADGVESEAFEAW
jgi:hypothetical protein